MMSNLTLTLLSRFILTSLFVSALAACGGGDGSDPSNIYNGVRSEAVLDTENSDDLSASAFTGSGAGESFGEGFVRTVGEAGQGSRTLKVLLFVADLIQPSGSSGATRALTREESSGSDTVDGNCGGSFSFSYTFDDETGGFSETLAFNDFCEDDETVSGEIRLLGVFDVDSPEFRLDATVVFDRVTFSFEGDEFRTAGRMTFSFTESAIDSRMDVVMSDDATGLSIWLNDFEVLTVLGDGYVDITLSGRFYESEHGFVTISTISPLRVVDFDLWPSSGEYILDGDDSSAHVDVLSNTTFQLSVDEDGDGNYDYTESLLWESFEL